MSSRSSASAPARPARAHSEGARPMKRFLVALALVAAIGVAVPVLAQDREAGTAAGTTPTAAPAPAAAPATASPAPTSPQLVSADKINAGDTAWMLTSTALVLMMTIPGLALFYGGMVRRKNVLATLMQSFAITCLVTV
ncbi:MAG: ammonia channel protein, partial [Casimicrobiaceae bacterium]